jgi:tryptophanyl-tRNA synthetase
MSKSLGNCIYLKDDEKTLKNKIMSMYTDPIHINVSDPGHTEGNPVFIYLDAFSKDEDFAKYFPDYKNLAEMKEHYERGGLGDMKCKKFLNNVMQEFLAPIRARREEYEKDKEQLIEILKKGTQRAIEVSNETVSEIRNAIGINYFNDKTFIDKFVL